MRSDRGTTLVELLVVVALISVMVMLASSLVVHSIKVLGATGRSLRNPLMVHVTSRLRNDLQTAAGVRAPEFAWNDGPLEIRTRKNSVVRFGLVDGNLTRQVLELDGAIREERILLRGVTAWWWRTPDTSVVDLRIGYLIHPTSEYQASRDADYSRERRTENLRFAVRGSSGGTGW